MKSLFILMSLLLTACNSDPTYSTPKSGPTSPITAVPLSPTPAAIPPVVIATTCQAFQNTIWINNSASGMVQTINNITGLFTETSQGISCIRHMSAGVPFGSASSLVWPATGIVNDPCDGLAGWFTFTVTSCNVLTVLVRNGSGQIIEADTYSPAP